VKHPPRNIDLTCFNWVKLILKTDMPSNAKYLGLYLSTWMNSSHDVAWPSLKRIEGETGLSHPSVLKYLNKLVEEGWLVKQSGDRITSNRYWINVPKQVIEEVGKVATYVTSGEGVGKEVTSNNNIITISTPSKENDVELIQSVIDNYHKLLPELPVIRKVTPKRQRQILKVNKEVEQNGGWTKFFTAVNCSDFLMGRNRRGWKADLEWLTKEDNLNKLLEGKYQ
jgi:hypothetical protein